MRFLLLAAFLFVAVPAVAQDGSETTEKRTVEGAQKFLVEFYSGQVEQKVSAFARPVTGGWQLNAGRPVGADDVSVRLVLAEIKSSARCTTTLAFRNLRKDVFGYPFPQELPNAPDRLESKIDWSHVTQVSVGPRREHVPVLNRADQVGWRVSASPGFMFDAPSEEIANRLAFAMNFLREQCAMKSDTGF